MKNKLAITSFIISLILAFFSLSVILIIFIPDSFRFLFFFLGDIDFVTWIQLILGSFNIFLSIFSLIIIKIKKYHVEGYGFALAGLIITILALLIYFLELISSIA